MAEEQKAAIIVEEEEEEAGGVLKRTRTQSENGAIWGRSSFHADPTESEEASNEISSSSGNQRLSLQVIPGHTETGSHSVKKWARVGKISERASEILEDACLSSHGKEKRLYGSSMQRLSLSTDPHLHTLGERLSLDGGGRATQTKNTSTGNSALDDAMAAVEAADKAMDVEPSQEISPQVIEIDFGNHVVHWEGVLSKRTEWLRRWEKHYYVLEGKLLKRFASRDAYQNSLSNSPNNSGRSKNCVSHVYVISGVKESSRQFGFTILTEGGKNLQVSASNNVEKVIWMRIMLEAIVSLSDFPLQPLDIEEFYAMFVVLYTAHQGSWKTEGDMAVTLPPPSEQVFSRFFLLLDSDVIFTSNYPPSVPFCGSYRGHEGIIKYIKEFAIHTIWSKFKMEGMAMEGSIAVASGREELQNSSDARKFVQNWVHKFTFTSEGKVSRIEINGDVVAASAVFKVPGAATTLKLPQSFEEVDIDRGRIGKCTIRVHKGHGLKVGSSQNKVVKDPWVMLTLQHSNQKVPPIVTINPSSSMVPKLTRKLSATLLGSSNQSNSQAPGSGGSGNSVPGSKIHTTGPSGGSSSPRSIRNPIWNAVLVLSFENVVGACTLDAELVDKSKGHEIIGNAKVNLAPFIMQSTTSSARWYTISNAKGEYCGKILLEISCSAEQSPDNLTNSTLSSTSSCGSNSNEKNTNSATPAKQLMHFKRHPSTSHLMESTSVNDIPQAKRTVSHPNVVERPRAATHTGREAAPTRSRGWSSMKLSPETVSTKPLSAGSTMNQKNIPQNDNSKNEGRDGISSVGDEIHTFSVCGAPFVVPKFYSLIKVCGRGAYGIVIAATNRKTGGNVAIKKVIDCIWHPHQLKQVLREVRLMRHLAHENILSLMDLIPPQTYTDFRDVYMTVDLMEMDLHRIIYSKEVLSDDHIRYFLYQILSGLEHMHAAGVLHRDLKPSNLLINSDCLLKICDLGLARPKDLEDAGMTEYVVTRWYRAPELLLGSAYGEGVDLWAAGCIFAEMLGRKPLFPGRSYVHQLQLIMNVLGVPEEHDFKENPQAQKLKGRQLLSKTPSMQGMDVSLLFPNANPEALDLLWKMLVFNSDERISVQDALRHPYLAPVFDKEKESREVEVFNSFDFEDVADGDLKELMFREICHFHPEQMEKRAEQLKLQPPEERLPQGWVKRESRSVPGKFYYSNPKKGVSTWVKPTV